MRYFLLVGVMSAVWFGSVAQAKVDSRPTYLLPTTCAELMPDSQPYLGFMEAVALGGAQSDRNFSKRVLRILALRTKLNEVSERARESRLQRGTRSHARPPCRAAPDVQCARTDAPRAPVDRGHRACGPPLSR